jgi:hypothetical protein
LYILICMTCTHIAIKVNIMLYKFALPVVAEAFILCAKCLL